MQPSTISQCNCTIKYNETTNNQYNWIIFLLISKFSNLYHFPSTCQKYSLLSITHYSPLLITLHYSLLFITQVLFCYPTSSSRCSGPCLSSSWSWCWGSTTGKDPSLSGESALCSEVSVSILQRWVYPLFRGEYKAFFVQRSVHSLFRSQCMLCSEVSACFVQKWVHALFRGKCILCSEVSACFVQRWVHALFRGECILCSEVSAFFVQKSVHALFRGECKSSFILYTSFSLLIQLLITIKCFWNFCAECLDFLNGSYMIYSFADYKTLTSFA